MRLVIFCEGDTEQKVLKDFLKPYCNGFQQVRTINRRGAGNLKDVQKVVAPALEASEAVALYLIDLLNAPFDFPKSVWGAKDPDQAKYHYLRQIISQQVDRTLRQRFHVFPIVMELETWLLADVDALNNYFSPPRAQRIQPWAAPEREPQPTEKLKALTRRFKKDDYKKTVHGRLLFKHASAERVYADQCPHFVEMIDTLLNIQGLKGGKPTA